MTRRDDPPLFRHPSVPAASVARSAHAPHPARLDLPVPQDVSVAGGSHHPMISFMLTSIHDIFIWVFSGIYVYMILYVIYVYVHSFIYLIIYLSVFS